MKRKFLIFAVLLFLLNSTYGQDTLPPIISGATIKWHHLLVEDKWQPNDNLNKDKYTWMVYSNYMMDQENIYLNYSCYNTFSSFDRNGNALYKINTQSGNMDWTYTYNQFHDYDKQETYFDNYFDKDGNIDLVGKIRLSDPETTNSVVGWISHHPSIPSVRKIDKNTGKLIAYIYDRNDTIGQLFRLASHYYFPNPKDPDKYNMFNSDFDSLAQMGFYSIALEDNMGCDNYEDKSFVYFNSDVPNVKEIEFSNALRSFVSAESNKYTGAMFQYDPNKMSRDRAKLFRMKMDENNRLVKVKEVNFEKDIVYPFGNIFFSHYPLLNDMDFLNMQYYDTTGLGLTSWVAIYDKDLNQYAYYKNLNLEGKKYFFQKFIHQEGNDVYFLAVVIEDYYGQVAYRSIVKFNIADGTITPLKKIIAEAPDPRTIRAFLPHLSKDKKTLIACIVARNDVDGKATQYIIGYDAKDWGMDFTSGIDATSDAQPFTCYPNPASDQVTVSFTDETNGTLHLYNAYGQLSLQKSIGGRDCAIDTADLIGGIYQLQYTDSQGVSSKAMPLVIIK
jgi:hypothetical protein